MAYSSGKIVIFFCMAVLLATAASARSIKKQSVCSKIAWAPEDHALCKKLAGKAHTCQEAIPIMLEKIQDKFLAGKHIAYGVADKMPKSTSAKTREGAGSLCHVAYENSLNSINQAIKDVELGRSQPVYTFSDCTDNLHKLKVTLPKVEKFQTEAGRSFNVLEAMYSLKELEA